jgi:hypothetical protein
LLKKSLDALKRGKNKALNITGQDPSSLSSKTAVHTKNVAKKTSTHVQALIATIPSAAAQQH